MLQARIYIETLKKQLQQHHGLNPQKYVQDIPGLPSNRVDLWTTVVGKWLIQFNHFWHCANFCIAANDKLTGTMLALQKSNAMLDRLSEIEPKWMACVAAMHGDPTRKQRALVDNEHLKGQLTFSETQGYQAKLIDLLNVPCPCYYDKV